MTLILIQCYSTRQENWRGPCPFTRRTWSACVTILTTISSLPTEKMEFSSYGSHKHFDPSPLSPHPSKTVVSVDAYPLSIVFSEGVCRLKNVGKTNLIVCSGSCQFVFSVLIDQMSITCWFLVSTYWWTILSPLPLIVCTLILNDRTYEQTLGDLLGLPFEHRRIPTRFHSVPSCFFPVSRL